MASKQSSYVDLIKPRILIMQWVTVSMGYYLASAISSFSWMTFLWLIVGTTGVSAGASLLNNVLEAKVDAKMERTKYRVLPSGRMHRTPAAFLGIILTGLGGWGLAQTTLLSAGIGVLTVVLYVLVYTPLKRVSWLNTFVGAIPGALPPMGGWAAATGEVSWMAWGLFSILFFWQLPHFFAIDWMYKEDYQKAGLVMLSRYDKDGRILSGLGFLFTIALTAVTLFPFFTGNLGLIYGVGALCCNIYLLKISYGFVKQSSKASAKKLLLATVMYLPLLLMCIVVDGILL